MRKIPCWLIFVSSLFIILYIFCVINSLSYRSFDSNILLAFSTSILAIAAIFSAAFAKKAVDETEKTAEATRKIVEIQTLSELIAEYSKEEMSDKLRELSDWKEEAEKSKVDFADLKTLEKEDPNKYKKVDAARRYVKYYFIRALYLSRTLSDKGIIMDSLGSLYGINLMLEVVKKMELNIVENDEKRDRISKDFFIRRINNDFDELSSIMIEVREHFSYKGKII